MKKKTKKCLDCIRLQKTVKRLESEKAEASSRAFSAQHAARNEAHRSIERLAEEARVVVDDLLIKLAVATTPSDKESALKDFVKIFFDDAPAPEKRDENKPFEMFKWRRS